jgi:nucleoside-diphosphate-sugar epimerase
LYIYSLYIIIEYLLKDDIKNIFKDQERVFHLAAVPGGRGYISTHPADVCSNFAIDHHVFEASSNANIEKVIFASTACVNPTKLLLPQYWFAL